MLAFLKQRPQRRATEMSGWEFVDIMERKADCELLASSKDLRLPGERAKTRRKAANIWFRWRRNL